MPSSLDLVTAAATQEGIQKGSGAPLVPEDGAEDDGLAAELAAEGRVENPRGIVSRRRLAAQLEKAYSAATPGPETDVLDLDRALRELETQNPRVASALELTCFAGLDTKATAAYLEISVQTLDRDLRFGRAWLKDRLSTP